MSSSTDRYPLLSFTTLLLALLGVVVQFIFFSSTSSILNDNTISTIPMDLFPSLNRFVGIELPNDDDRQGLDLSYSSMSLKNKSNAVLYVLCRNSDLYSLLETIQIYEDRFNHKFKYDWVFLNDEPFNENFITVVRNSVSGAAKFGQIPKSQWDTPETVNIQSMNNSMAQMMNDPEGVVPYANSLSYRHMCRFESGYFYNHDLLLPYDYYWRVEPGVKLFCNLDEDPFQVMELGKFKYGFSLSTLEYPKTIPSLFKVFKNYLQQTNQSSLLRNQTNYSEFIYDESKDDYNMCHFWTNFEIGDLNFLRSKEYNDIFNYLDSTNGFYYERWGDAPVRSLILSILLNKGEIKRFEEIGYRHGPYLQCPSSHEVRLKYKCSCDPDQDFTNRMFSCSWFFDEINKH